MNQRSDAGHEKQPQSIQLVDVKSKINFEISKLYPVKKMNMDRFACTFDRSKDEYRQNKDAATVSVAIAPDNLLLMLRPPRNNSKKPTKGKMMVMSIDSSIYYPFKFLSLSISMLPIFLYIDTKIASPIATSAAATAILKNTKTCPLAS